MAGVKKLVVEKTMAQKQEISVVFNYVAIHFIVSGVGYFNGKRLTAGDGFVCDLGQLCNYYPDKNDPWEYIWLIVEDGNGGGFKSYKENGYVFKFERWSELRMLCLEFSANPEKLSDGKYSESVFTIIDSYRTDFKAEMTEPAAELVDKAEIYMKEHIFERDAIADVAASLHISGGYLRYLFKAQKGISPKGYLNSIRISRSQELLSATNYPIFRIASSVGYSDAQAFSKFFKNQTGLSPLDYRKQHKKSCL